MSTQILVVKEKVQRFLTELFGGIEIDKDGDFTFRHGSTRVWITLQPFRDTQVVVKVSAIPLLEVTPTPELHEFVATKGTYAFGHLSVSAPKDGKVALYFSHSLLGDYLDPEEFKVAVFMVASIAEHLDDELKKHFGGRFFHEPDSGTPA